MAYIQKRQVLVVVDHLHTTIYHTVARTMALHGHNPFPGNRGGERVCVHTLINDSYIIATSMVVLSKLTDVHVHVAAADNETVYLAVCSQLVGRPPWCGIVEMIGL